MRYKSHRCPPIPTATALLAPLATLPCRVHHHRRRRRRRRRCRCRLAATSPAWFQPVPNQAAAADDRSIGGVLPGPRPLWERGCAWRCLILSCSLATASANPFPALAARCRARSTAWQDDTPQERGCTATAWETYCHNIKIDLVIGFFLFVLFRCSHSALNARSSRCRAVAPSCAPELPRPVA